jgi:citrate/tricarballylate utilization protein
MHADELLRSGEHVMTVCNACRYCEQYCPVFPAMENRLTFARGDLTFLANLCHNCGECLYACQYAPPHEFGIDVPRTLAEIRLLSYREYCWPRRMAGLFHAHGIVTSLAVASVLSAIVLALALVSGEGHVARTDGRGDFYSVIPHGVMVSVFGGVFGFALMALAIGLQRFWRDMGGAASEPVSMRVMRTALRDALSLRHLHDAGADCTDAEETRTPWRRWFHHCTFYGFMLCFASTSVAAAYHAAGWPAPYDYTSLPVVLGTLGGVGLLVGPAGLLVHRRSRDAALGDPAQRGLDQSFIVLLFVISATGLSLLALRETAAMGLLLVVHLGCVLALFLSLPYGKFVHGIYRVAALVKHASEEDAGRR